MAYPFEGPGHDLFRVSQSIHRGGIDPVDTRIQSLPNGGDGVGVVLAAPGKSPTPTANGPGPKADRGDLQVRMAERFRLHIGDLPWYGKNQSRKHDRRKHEKKERIKAHFFE